jgi:hypothetical protein
MEEDKDEILLRTNFYITRFGVHGMVEGIGYVGVNGIKPTETPDSGIIVAPGYDEFDFEIL